MNASMPCKTRNKDWESPTVERYACCSSIRVAKELGSGFRLPPGLRTWAPGRAGADCERGEMASVLESQEGVHTFHWLPFTQLEALHITH